MFFACSCAFSYGAVQIYCKHIAIVIVNNQIA